MTVTTRKRHAIRGAARFLALVCACACAYACAGDRSASPARTGDNAAQPGVASTSATPANPSDASASSWCAAIPRRENKAFERVRVPGDWYTVYRVEPGVIAIVEAKQCQEAISYLVIGTERALLFDSGIGLVPLKPVIDALTTLPVMVVNSHTRFDHVGGNHEFRDVVGMDTPFSRANDRGRPHAAVANEVAPEAFCGTPPAVLTPWPFAHARGRSHVAWPGAIASTSAVAR